MQLEPLLFQIDRQAAKAYAYTDVKQPGFLVYLDQDNLATTPILKDSGGKVISWREKGMDPGTRTVYATKLGINGNDRRYTLTAIPESGDNTKAATYQIYVNQKAVKPTGVKAAASKKSSAITLKWNKGEFATGYKIYRSEQKSNGYYYLKTLKSANTIKYNDKNVEKGKTYFYKIIPYRTVNGKTVNGPTSAIASAKALR
jgi:hypothetical protein